MKKKSEKTKDLDALRNVLGSVPHVFVAGFQKLTVAQDYALRKVIRGAGGSYEVVKNNLAAIASQGTASEPVMTKLAGMTSIAYTATDPVALAKALTNYAKTNPAFTFKAGIVEGRAIDVKSIQELASLPSRDELLSKVLFLINSPAQRLVTAISGVGRNLAVVVDQGVKENKFQQ
ncbi:MAG: 50S ribosomal protein L10 [Acidobacteria bacterium]|nr:50S ribosomal protein L10 [Acidobacteriota bacterium]